MEHGVYLRGVTNVSHEVGAQQDKVGDLSFSDLSFVCVATPGRGIKRGDAERFGGCESGVDERLQFLMDGSPRHHMIVIGAAVGTEVPRHSGFEGSDGILFPALSDGYAQGEGAGFEGAPAPEL